VLDSVRVSSHNLSVTMKGIKNPLIFRDGDKFEDIFIISSTDTHSVSLVE